MPSESGQPLFLSQADAAAVGLTTAEIVQTLALELIDPVDPGGHV